MTPFLIIKYPFLDPLSWRSRLKKPFVLFTTEKREKGQKRDQKQAKQKQEVIDYNKEMFTHCSCISMSCSLVHKNWMFPPINNDIMYSIPLLTPLYYNTYHLDFV